MKRLLLIVALVLLPTAVLAECAWVEWFQVSLGKTVYEWDPQRPFETLGECKKEVEQRLRNLASKPGAQRFGDMVTQIVGEVPMSSTIRCLPDTVDPRGH